MNARHPPFARSVPLAMLFLAGLALLLAAPLSEAQAAHPSGISLRTVSEVETARSDPGKAAVHLAGADHVVAGDRLVYTLEIRNTTAHPIAGVVATTPVPDRMGFVAGSAQGPGADIEYSVDGGQTFGKPETLSIKLAAGQSRPAVAADYTHIRWKLKYDLSGNSIAFARFRASLK